MNIDKDQLMQDGINADMFTLACEMLPEGVHWGDHITPHIVLDILTASESNQVDTLKAELEAVKKERDAALKMSLCECAADECCANLVAKDDQIAKVRERTARECAAICDSVTDEEVRPTGTSVGGYCAELIRNKFGVTG